jgi:hypothetical protein
MFTTLHLRTIEATPKTAIIANLQGIPINQGVTEQIYYKKNQQAVRKFLQANVTQEEPGFTASCSKFDLITMSLLFGHQFAPESITDAVYNPVLRSGKGTFAAAAVGQEGNGMAADQATSEMVYVSEFGVITPMTRQPFATFVPATPKSFAQGLDGAIKVSDDIKALDAWIVPYFFYPVTDAQALQQVAWPAMKAVLTGVLLRDDNSKQVFQLKYDRVQLNRQENSQIDMEASPFNIAFRVADDACVPNLKVFPLINKC